jgi:peroxiredoxin
MTATGSPPTNAERLAAAFRHFRDLDAPLQDRLAGYAAASLDILPDYGRAVDRLVRRLADNGGGEHAPRIGDEMPPFVLPDDTGRLVSLDQLVAQGPVAVMFHRGHWCPYCRINFAAVVRARDQILAGGGQVVAIMPERQQYAAAFRQESGGVFPVLTDLDNAYALLLNLAIWLGPELQALLGGGGRVLPDYQGNDFWMLPIPATFVVGRDGLVKARFVDPDFRNRMDIDELLAALRS